MNQKQTSEVVKTIAALKEITSQLQGIAHNPRPYGCGEKAVILNPTAFERSLKEMQKNLDFVLDQVLNPTDEE